jgi:hypothetical protein
MGVGGTFLLISLAVGLLRMPSGALAAADADDPSARAALLAFGSAVGASGLAPMHPGQAPWGSGGSYCSWRGVACCGAAAALLPRSCAGDAAVVAIDLTAAGLRGVLPSTGLAAPLESSLQLLLLGHNPGLAGVWPAAMALPQVALLDVQVRAWSDEGWIQGWSAPMPLAVAHCTHKHQATIKGERPLHLCVDTHIGSWDRGRRVHPHPHMA